MHPTDTSQLIQAIHFAAHKHRHQRRKDAAQSPYINHPIELLKVLSQEAGITDIVVLISALLHDTVEDTDTTLAEIQTLFGAEVAAVVAQVTDDKSLPQATRKQLQIDHAATLGDRAKLVKLADKIANLRDIATAPPPNWSVERRLDYCHWSKQVVDQIRGHHPLLESLFDQAYVAACETWQTPQVAADNPPAS
ncbi:MAG TPA: HD domain-containing protein [Candidatus Obscuribacterales bacterium]